MVVRAMIDLASPDACSEQSLLYERRAQAYLILLKHGNDSNAKVRAAIVQGLGQLCSVDTLCYMPFGASGFLSLLDMRSRDWSSRVRDAAEVAAAATSCSLPFGDPKFKRPIFPTLR